MKHQSDFMLLFLLRQLFHHGPDDWMQQAVLTAMIHLCDTETRACREPIAVLAKASRLSEGSIHRTVKALVADGWVTCHRPNNHTPAIYTLTDRLLTAHDGGRQCEPTTPRGCA